MENSGVLLSLGSDDISMKWAESEYYDTNVAEILVTPIESEYNVSLRRVTMEKKRRRVEMAQMYSYLYVKKSKVTGRKTDYVISFSPDRKYMKRHKTDLVSCFHYDPRKTDFTGYYLVSKNDGTFLYGIRYDNGKECFRVYPRDRAPLSAQINDPSIRTKMCHFNIISEKMNTRSSDDDNELIFMGCVKCHRLDDECECFVVTPTPNDSGDDDGDDSGDPLPNDGDDDPNFNRDSGESSSGGGSGGGGGSSVGGGGSSTGGTPTIGLPNVTVTAAKMKSTARSVFAEIKGPKAQCNIGVANMFEQIFGFPMTSPRPLANDMVKFWQRSSNWTQISLAEAVEMVNKGYFVVAGWVNPNANQSGHVVVLLPGSPEYRKAWGGNIPYCMDTGPQGIRSECHLISSSFGKDKIKGIVYYYYKK